MRDDARELTRTWTTSSGGTPWARWFLLRGVRDPHLHAAHLDLLFLCWGCFLVNTFSNTHTLPRVTFSSLNGKNQVVRILACKTRNVATSILRVPTSENVTSCAVGWYLCDDSHRTLKGFQISCRKSESNGKIPTLENGAFNRGCSSTLYEYAEPRNVTSFNSRSYYIFLTTDSRLKVKSAALRL
jgi:hypothetical protein